MPDGRRSMRWRAAIMLVGTGLVIAWVVMTGGTTHIIQIDFRWFGPFLEGAQVEIDGQVVGTLRPYGRNNWVTGFEVEAGEHTVRVLKEGCDSSRPEPVTLGGMEGRLKTFMADVDDGWRCRVILR